MRRVEWNGPGLYYYLWYRKVNSGDALVRVRLDPSRDTFVVPDAGYYVQWEFQIQANNEVGDGPKSPLVKQFSGQDAPTGKPESVTVGTITARSVQLSWQPVTVTRGSVDGYRVRGSILPYFSWSFLFLLSFFFIFFLFSFKFSATKKNNKAFLNCEQYLNY